MPNPPLMRATRISRCHRSRRLPPIPARRRRRDILRRPSTLRATVLWPCGWVRMLVPLVLAGGCAPWDRPLPIPAEVSRDGATARIVVPFDLDLSRKPGGAAVNPAPPGHEPSPPASHGLEGERTTFALADAIAFALRNSPRLRSARAGIERARGQEQVAFAPFLPQVDVLGQYGVVSGTLAPGVPGNVGFLLANGSGTRSYAETELGLQWTLYDFGRTGGRYRQAVARGRVAEFQLARADQTVQFDVATAYLDVLLARAFRRGPVDAARPAAADRGRGGGGGGGGRRAPGRGGACGGTAGGGQGGPGRGKGERFRRPAPPEHRQGTGRQRAARGDRRRRAAAVARSARRSPGAR